jgi:hypothetical protein
VRGTCSQPQPTGGAAAPSVAVGIYALLHWLRHIGLLLVAFTALCSAGGPGHCMGQGLMYNSGLASSKQSYNCKSCVLKRVPWHQAAAVAVPAAPSGRQAGRLQPIGVLFGSASNLLADRSAVHAVWVFERAS